MKKISLLLTLIIAVNTYSQTAKYAPAWFGPNANPVPEFTDARIPLNTTISLMGDHYFGYDDRTSNGYFKIEIPLLPGLVSFKIWSSIFEHYYVTPELSNYREMNGNTSGKANGDFYVQTRISLLTEKKTRPSVILNTTLKTASGTKFKERRYFDTPGYYFDLEIGKSWYVKSKYINEIRTVANVGFLCWETTNSTQDDAPMYGGKLILKNKNLQLDNTLSGYWGWIHTNKWLSPLGDYGDAPLVFATKITYIAEYMNYFIQYQYGIKDFPYQQIRVGISFPLESLTPKYKFYRSIK